MNITVKQLRTMICEALVEYGGALKCRACGVTIPPGQELYDDLDDPVDRALCKKCATDPMV